MLTAWLKAFILTQLIEMPVYVMALQRWGKCPRTPPKNFLIAFGASLVTHPFVWFVFPQTLMPIGYGVYFIVAESFAVVVEAIYLKKFGLSSPWCFSLLANGLSASVGLLINYFMKGLL